MKGQDSNDNGVQGSCVEDERGTQPMHCRRQICGAEMARQPARVSVINTGMAKPVYRVRVELIEIREFLERHPPPFFSFFLPPLEQVHLYGEATFSLAFAFARNVERWAVGELAFAFVPGSTGWSADGVWKRREVGLVLLGAKVSERLLSGCAAAFAGGTRTNLKSGSGILV